MHRRSIFVINRGFQLRFAVYVSCWLVALSFVYPIIIYNLFEYFSAVIRAAAASPGVLVSMPIEEIKSQILVLLLVFQLIFTTLSFLMSIFMSHRIAGPIYKLRKFFADARAGNIGNELYFRKKDHFKELAEDYNSMMSSIRASMERKDRAISDAAASIQKAIASTSPETKLELEAALKQLQSSQTR